MVQLNLALACRLKQVTADCCHASRGTIYAAVPAVPAVAADVDAHSPLLHRPQKKCHFAVFLHKSTTGSTSTCVFFLYDIPSLCRNFSYTFDPKAPPGDGLLGALTTVWQSDSGFRAL